MAIVSANGAATPLSPNYIINGAFDFWQRGTSFTFSGTGNYTADRFTVTSGVGGVVTATQGSFQPGEELVPGIGAQYFINLNYTTSGTGAADNGQHIEDVRSLAGQAIVVSMWAKVSTGTHVVTPQAVQRFGAGGSSAGATGGASWTLTTSWQRFSSIINVPSVAGKTIGAGSSLQIRFDLGTTGVKQFQFWGLEVEAGTVATPFRRNANSLQGELAACQRYYEKSYNINVAPGTSTGIGAVYAGVTSDSYNNGLYVINFKVNKRVAPSMLVWTIGGTSNVWEYFRSGASGTGSSVWDTGSWSGETGGLLYTSVGASYTPVIVRGHWVASAEL